MPRQNESRITQSTLIPVGLVITIVVVAFGYGFDRNRLSTIEKENTEIKEHLKSVDLKLDELVKSSARVEARLGIPKESREQP